MNSNDDSRSFEQIRDDFHVSRGSFLIAFEKRLNGYVGEDPSTKERRKEIVDEINETKRDLAVSIAYKETSSSKPVCVYLELVCTSFQLRLTNATRKQVYCGTSFPQLEILKK